MPRKKEDPKRPDRGDALPKLPTAPWAEVVDQLRGRQPPAGWPRPGEEPKEKGRPRGFPFG